MTAELADFEPSTGHRHDCLAVTPLTPELRVCDCALQLYELITASRDIIVKIDATPDEVDGVPSSVLQEWMTTCYLPAVGAFMEFFEEFGVTRDAAEHNARALLSRLMHLDPALSIELLK